MTIYITAIALLAVAAVVLALALASAGRKHGAEKEALASENIALREKLTASEAKAAEVQQAAASQAMELASENSALKARLDLMGEQAEKQKEELAKLQDSFRLEFRNLANDILEEKTKQFKDASQQSLDTLLKPFRSSITEFRERVETIYADDNRQRGALEKQILNLHELNRRITEETTNLTNALKGDSKVQGDWGEIILQRLLEHTSLIPGVHFETQQTIKDAEGNNMRPDVIVRLPGEKQVVIDSKVSLTAYSGYCSDCEPAERDKFLKEHIVSVRRHIEELGRKNYQELPGLSSPDFVIMFVPNEHAYLCAMQHDSAIWTDAYNKKVIVSSPTNLLALLKIVHELWRRDDQSRNALEIADRGARLYDKFAGFVETLETLGKSISSAGGLYDKAMKQLATGNGSLLSQTENLRKLGLKTRRRLDKKLIEEAGTDDTDLTGEEGEESEEDGGTVPQDAGEAVGEVPAMAGDGDRVSGE